MSIDFPPIELPPNTQALREEVRGFLRAEKPPGSSFVDSSAPFSRVLGQRGWIGMTWPRRWGGGERSSLERFVVTEELLAAGAPIFHHWVADRQSGPLILKYGTDEQRRTFLPRIARGECGFAIGLSEPDAGSDLSGVRTRAVRCSDGWRITGTKLWTSNAHNVDFIIVFCRTAPRAADRRAGFTQFIVDLRAPGITINPILNIERRHEFNEVVFDDVLVPDERVLGIPDEGWQQLLSELALERSGADRFLSVFHLFRALVDEVGPDPTDAQAATIGRLASHLWTLRRMSLSVAGMLQREESPDVQAAIVKDLGTRFEQELPARCRELYPVAPGEPAESPLGRALAKATLYVPRVTIQGGTQEILRNGIARGLGLR